MGNNTIRQIAPVGTNYVVTTIAGSAGQAGSIDGQGSDARFACPMRLTVNRSGQLFVTDACDHTIRKLTLAGAKWVVSTIAGRAGVSGYRNGPGSEALFSSPDGVAVDGSGAVYVTDSGNDVVRIITPAGNNWTVRTVAGAPGVSGATDGSALGARFAGPMGVAVDEAGTSIYVTDTLNHTVRKLTLIDDTWTVSRSPGNPAIPATGMGLEQRHSSTSLAA